MASMGDDDGTDTKQGFDKMTEVLYKNPERSLGEIKKLSVKTHPDHNHDSETAAIIQTLLNDLATQLRKAVRTNTKR